MKILFKMSIAICLTFAFIKIGSQDLKDSESEQLAYCNDVKLKIYPDYKAVCVDNELKN